MKRPPDINHHAKLKSKAAKVAAASLSSSSSSSSSSLSKKGWLTNLVLVVAVVISMSVFFIHHSMPATPSRAFRPSVSSSSGNSNGNGNGNGNVNVNNANIAPPPIQLKRSGESNSPSSSSSSDLAGTVTLAQNDPGTTSFNSGSSSSNGDSNSKGKGKSKSTSKIKPSKKNKEPKVYAFDIDPEPGSEGKYIELYSWYPGSKSGIRRDRVVNLSSIPLLPHGHALPPLTANDAPLVRGQTRAFAQTLSLLKAHPFSYIYTDRSQSLVELSLNLMAQPQCKNIPIFTTMATVGEDLYWQLIENFMYSMVRFNVSDCAFIICVSDSNCMKLCDKFNFPCYDYRYDKLPMPSVMEQIAIIKLVEIPHILRKGGSIFLLDLDVGFLESPMIMIQAFNESPKMDIFVQEDLIFIMNRTKAGWKTWSTQPLANIGMFLCRGNERTVKVFDMAWDKYKGMEDLDSKANPGKDQNHVLDAMRFGRFNFDLKYAYFSNRTAMLLDKVFKFDTTLLELGGEASSEYLARHRTIAMHSTCYEHVTKVMGLKATNAFWHPRYYDPIRPTITKQLIFVTKEQLVDELRALVMLGILTNRAVIVPNILGSSEIPDDTIERYHGQRLWPGFRVLYFYGSKSKVKLPDSVSVDVLEPGFYWRVARDYEEPPSPSILSFEPSESISSIQKRLETMDIDKHPRVVLHASKSSRVRINDVQLGEINEKWGGRESPDKASLVRSLRAVETEESMSTSITPELIASSSRRRRLDNVEASTSQRSEERVKVWAQDSVGLFARPFAEELMDYGILPSAQSLIHTKDQELRPIYDFVFKGMRTCQGIFSPLKGNRTCFQICE